MLQVHHVGGWLTWSFQQVQPVSLKKHDKIVLAKLSIDPEGLQWVSLKALHVQRRRGHWPPYKLLTKGQRTLKNQVTALSGSVFRICNSRLCCGWRQRHEAFPALASLLAFGYLQNAFTPSSHRVQDGAFSDSQELAST